MLLKTKKSIRRVDSIIEYETITCIRENVYRYWLLGQMIIIPSKCI
jgi:hypothetical protein